MPGWLVPVLKWGGLAVAIVFAIALIYVQQLAPESGEAAAETAAPVALYWVLLVVGVVATIIGFVMDRRKGQPTATS